MAKSVLAAKLLTSLGFVIQPVGGGAWLVRRKMGANLTTVQQVDDGLWLVQKGHRRVRRIGPRDARTHLVYDRAGSRRRPGAVQRGLGRFLADEQLAWALAALEVNCVLDVGANVGQFANSLRKSGYRGRIVSFEPLSHFAEILEKKSADDPHWMVRRCALGDEDTEAEINVTPGTLSSLRESSEFGRTWSKRFGEVHKESISLRRLDGLFDDAVAGLDVPRVFLKLDTQGFDVQAFRGAGSRIQEILGLQSEVACVPIYDGMPRMPEQIAEYEQAGFEVAGMFPVTRHRRTLRIIEFDVVMVRADEVRAD
jgi:FkbM family methyltransferase